MWSYIRYYGDTQVTDQIAYCGYSNTAESENVEGKQSESLLCS